MRALGISMLLPLALAILTCAGSPKRLEVSGLTQSSGNPVDEDPIFTRPELERFVSLLGRVSADSAWWISDFFCEFLESQPTVFFSVMQEHPDAFETWLGTLEENSFVDRGGCLDRECFRQRMLSRLDTILLFKQLDDRIPEDMLRRVRLRLEEIRVQRRQI